MVRVSWWKVHEGSLVLETGEWLGDVRQLKQGSASFVTSLQVDELVALFKFVVALRQLGASTDSQGTLCTSSWTSLLS